MLQQLTIPITQEYADLLQKLGIEVDSKMFLINYLSKEGASQDIISIYTQEYERVFAEFQLAKQSFKQNYLDKKVQEIIGLSQIKYNWRIDDYYKLECQVTILD